MPDVERGELATQPVLSVRFRVKPVDFGAKLAVVFPAVFAFAGEHGFEIAGMPFSRYHDHDAERGMFEIEAGIPVKAISSPVDHSLADVGEVRSSQLPGGPALTLLHVGPYENLGDAHDALARSLEEMGVAANGAPWEVYVSDPGEVDDPAALRTLLVQPIRP